MRLVCLTLAQTILALSMPAAAQQVTSVNGTKFTISAGSSAGIAVGMTGTLCRREAAGGKSIDYCPLAFEVVSVTESSAVAFVVKGDASELALDLRPRFRGLSAPRGKSATGREASRPTAKESSARTPERTDGRSGIRWQRIPPGTFTMGCTSGDTECETGEYPARRVTLTKAFLMAETETTVSQFEAFARTTGAQMPPRPAFPAGSDHPIVNVSWDEAVQFCRWAGGRLPSEAEWERAARGGTDAGRYPWGNSITHRYANYLGTGETDHWTGTSPVRGFGANQFGLYDMSGNVWEWVEDWYEESYYERGSRTDPLGPGAGQQRVLRGGSWSNGPRNLRVSFRFRSPPADRFVSYGFRCASEVGR